MVKIHIVTMVVDEIDYLTIWLCHWRKYLPDNHLHVLCHGKNSELAELAKGVDFHIIPRADPYEAMEVDRWRMLSGFVGGLVDQSCLVVYTDVDEILISDPQSGRSILEHLEATQARVSYSQGLEVIHRQDHEPAPISLAGNILKQRQHFRVSSFYSKPCIIRGPVNWGRGGHFVNNPDLTFAAGVYTIHLRFYDMPRFLARARVRRQTTKSESELAKVHHRRWRNSEAGALDLVSKLQAMRLPRSRSLRTWPMRFKMRLTFRPHDKHPGLYRYSLFTGQLQRFPQRMLNQL